MGRAPQSTGPSGDKRLWRHVLYRSLLKRERPSVADETCCSTAALRVRAPRAPARAVVCPCSAVACAGPDAGGQEARTMARRGAPRAYTHYEGTTPVRRPAARFSHCVLRAPGAPAQGGQWLAGPRSWSVPAIDRPERREGNGAPRVPVATQERERPSVADETCCSTAALRVRAPGHQHRAADGRRVPAMGRVPQSTGPSGEKDNGATCCCRYSTSTLERAGRALPT